MFSLFRLKRNWYLTKQVLTQRIAYWLKLVLSLFNRWNGQQNWFCVEWLWWVICVFRCHIFVRPITILSCVFHQYLWSFSFYSNDWFTFLKMICIFTNSTTGSSSSSSDYGELAVLSTQTTVSAANGIIKYLKIFSWFNFQIQLCSFGFQTQRKALKKLNPKNSLRCNQLKTKLWLRSRTTFTMALSHKLKFSIKTQTLTNIDIPRLLYSHLRPN